MSWEIAGQFYIKSVYAMIYWTDVKWSEIFYTMLLIILILLFTYNNESPYLLFSYNESPYLLCLLPPFSLNKIHFVHDFQVKSLNIFEERKSMLILKNLTRDLTIFLDNLNEKDNYWANFSFYTDIAVYNEGPKMNLCDPILINKDSCPLLLTKFIMNRLNLMIDSYYLEDYKEDGYLDSIIGKNIDNSIEKMIIENPGVNKQQIIERLIKENPLHKDRILSKISQSVDKQILEIESKLSLKNIKKLRKQLTKEDLNEIRDLGENKSIDQIKTLKAINKSHENFLHEIKTKVSQSSISQSTKESFDDANNDNKFDDTINLFD